MARLFTLLISLLLAVISAYGAAVDVSDSEVEKRTSFSGEALWSYQGVGACGILAKDSELVTGVQAKYFDSYPGYNGKNPNKNPLCGKYLTATYKGKKVTVKITERFVGHGGKYDLLLSPAAFKKLANPDEGHISPVHWVQD